MSSGPDPERRLLGALERPYYDRVDPSELGSDRALYVSGWAFANDGADLHVHVQLGDAPATTTPCGVMRGDVGGVHSESSWAGRSGFGVRLPVPKQRELRLRVEACSGHERQLLADRTLELPLDTPPRVALPRAPRPAARRRRSGPPHVLWVSHRLNLEGAPRSLFDVADGLRSRYRMSLLSPVEGPLGASWQEAGIPVHIQPLEIQGSVDDYEATVRRLAALRSADPPDLVVVNTLDAFWGVDLAHELGVPAIWIIRESEPPESYFHDRWPTGMAERLGQCFARASRLVFVAHATERMFRGVSQGPGSTVIWNGIDHGVVDRHRSKDELRRALDLPLDRPILLSVGTPCHRKGQLVLLRALEQLRSREPKPLCVFLGTRQGDYLELMRQTIEDARLHDFVLLREETTEPLPYYGAADVCVCPSFQESLPRVVMEAAAFGTPTIASDIHGVPEMLRHEREGLLVRAGDEMDLARAIDRLLGDESEQRRLGSAALARSKEHFSLAGAIANYDRLFGELLQEGSPG